MKKIALGVAFVAILLLAGCEDDRVAQIQNAVRLGCGIVPTARDLALVIQHPEYVGPLEVADMICKQYLAKSEVQTLVPDACVATVYDVCVHKE